MGIIAEVLVVGFRMPETVVFSQEIVGFVPIHAKINKC
jgi:hypothetical protein